MVSRCFPTMRDHGLMKDEFHCFQAGYNEAGREAGMNAAAWVMSLEMYDMNTIDIELF